jgi:hypothetical protein
MRSPATLTIVDEKPQVELEDGTIIEHKQIGYIAHGWGIKPTDFIYDLITPSDIEFILQNEIDIEVEMVDEFSSPELYENIPLFEGLAKPKLIKNKIIIHLK